MPFDSGSMSFMRFMVVGPEQPKFPDEAMLQKFAALALRQDELSTAEIDYGWCAGRHVLDGEFTVGNCVFNDCIHVGLRIDTNKVPSELRKSYVALEENAAAAGNLSGFASRKQKREARETAGRQIEQDLASGKYRRSKMVSVLWDVPVGIVYAAVSSSQRLQLEELFERTFNLQLSLMSSGAIACDAADRVGKRREYEDLSPTRFATLPGDPPAEYPWTAKGDQAKDFLGNEFLVWLWFTAGNKGGEVTTYDPAITAQTFTVMFSKAMLLDCSYGQSGKIGATFESPTEMAEAADALRSGKVPRKAGLTVAAHGQLHTFTLGAEQLSFAGLKLPEVEKADSPRVLFEERITLLRNWMLSFDRIYAEFLRWRGNTARWRSVVDAVRKWNAVKKAS